MRVELSPNVEVRVVRGTIAEVRSKTDPAPANDSKRELTSMLQVARWRVILVLVVTLLGIVFAAPNVLPENARASCRRFLQKTINLGLDLRGGSQLLLEVDTATLRRQQAREHRRTR